MNYFTDAETTVTDTGLSNVPDAVQQVNIEHTRQQMNRVRVIIGKPVNINSWFRSPSVNRAIGRMMNWTQILTECGVKRLIFNNEESKMKYPIFSMCP